MGLSIYYKGKLKSKEILTELMEELIEVAEVHQWDYDEFETDLKNSDFNSEEFDNDIYGIILGPPGCEPLCFTFLSNGNICSPFALEHYLETKDKSLLNQIFVKTQYAGPVIHQLVIHLLDYISTKYFLDFELSDETDYWKHRDAKILNEKFEEMNRILNYVIDNLNSANLKPGEDLEDYFKTLMSNFKDRKKG